MSEEKGSGSFRRGSIFWPLVLIVLGVIFLLNNIGTLTGDVWDTLVNLWPVLLIVAGLDGLYRREGVVGTTFLIGLGVIFLTANLGLLNVNVWRMVFSLWPVLLIAIGFDLIIRRRSVWLSLMALLLVLAILAGSLWLAGARISQEQTLVGEKIQQALPNASHARLVLELGAGNVRLYPLTRGDNLVMGKVSLGRGGEVFQDFSQGGDTAVFTLRNSGIGLFIGRDTWSWDLGLSPRLPLDLELSLGAGNAELDLRGLQVEQLDVNMGVGKTTVTLPEAGQFEASVNSAIGQIAIIVPRQMALRVQSNTALANVNVPPGFRKEDGVCISPRYNTAVNRVDLEVGMAIGNITIREVP